MDMKVELLVSFSFSRKVLLAFDENVSSSPSVKSSLSTCLAMSSQPELETVKEVIVRELLNVFSKLLVVIVLETVIVQSAYGPSLRELKVMVLLPEIAEVVLEEHEPP